MYLKHTLFGIFWQQVVKNMSVTCESLLTILSPLLQDTDKSIKEIMEEIGECNSWVNIHIALTCIRLFLCIPIVLLKPSWKKPPGRPKLYNIIEWHAVLFDKQKSAADKLFCVWNGNNYCVPAIPTPIAELNTNLSNVEESIDEAKDLINEIKEMLPKSKIKYTVIEIEKQIKFSGELWLPST